MFKEQKAPNCTNDPVQRGLYQNESAENRLTNQKLTPVTLSAQAAIDWLTVSMAAQSRMSPPW